MRKKIFLCAGEASGDLHGSHLVDALTALDPGLSFFGVGGDAMRASGVRVDTDIADLAVVGLWEVARQYPRIRRVFLHLLAALDAERPDAAILIDYPGFNLRLAQELKKRHIPVIYYISPQVWAWGRSRIGHIGRVVDDMVVFFPFEEELYRTHGIPTYWAGHPLVDVVRPSVPRDQFLAAHGLCPEQKTVALLPGSRANEVRALLPVMMDAAARIHEQAPRTQFILAAAPGLPATLFTPSSTRPPLPLVTLKGRSYDILNAADLAIVASGTATLETALLTVPMIVTYKTAALTWLIGRLLVRIPYLGLVNILAEKAICPELLQQEATGTRLAAQALALLSDEAAAGRMREDLARVRERLGPPGACRRAATHIIQRL